MQTLTPLSLSCVYDDVDHFRRQKSTIIVSLSLMAKGELGSDLTNQRVIQLSSERLASLIYYRQASLTKLISSTDSFIHPFLL